MKETTKIIVVINRSTDADYVLHKAAAIAKSSSKGASVLVVRVMFEDLIEHTHVDPEATQALKLYLMQAEEEFLVDLVEEHKENFVDLETATLWNKRVSDAVAKASETFSADLIIKSADPDSAHFPRHPDDWNLLRDATCPVFLVKPEPWPADPAVLAAINVSDIDHQEMNTRIIDAAARLNRVLAGKLHVVNALPRTNPLLISSEINVDFEQLERDVEREVVGQLNEVLKALDVDGAQIHVEAGVAAQVVAAAAETNNASVVVVGTAGRHGVSALIIGNTSEKLLHTLHQDLLVLHA
jgi:universal stress protein E